ncbi:phosphotransferase [Sodalis sp. CWE]|uniref:phosphotransferase n=1 Tax=Sodalis sp. CWE TaxID=2803816 RepID=UPI001C7DE706|nr:phosphotransferase [Sodalis sp. CWE]
MFLKRTRILKCEPVQGLTNDSWRLRGIKNDLLIRSTNKHKIQLGINRHREFRLLRSLNDTNLAPRPRANNAGLLLLDWIYGESIKELDWQSITIVSKLATALASLHQRRCCGYPINLLERYIHYWQNSDPSRRSPAWLKLQHHFLNQNQPKVLRRAFLHMDVHRKNVLKKKSGSLVLIDWEYAGDGDIALELSMFFCNNNFSTEARECFLRGYTKKLHGIEFNKLSQQIKKWTPWVKYLILLWYEVRWQQTKNPNFIVMAEPLRYYFNLAK